MKTLVAIFISLRPPQWTKNLIVFVALIFSKNLLVGPRFLLSLIAFCIFCFISGAIYIFNDLLDREFDKLSPKKSGRPIASGKLNPKTAFLFAFLLMVASLIVALKINTVFFLVCLLYAAIQILYSVSLKHIVIIDVFCIAVGFVLRLIAGAVAIDVAVSSWFILCTMLISLFLALSKRRSELLLTINHHNVRPVLKEYSSRFLDQAISLVSSATVISYALYTLSHETIAKFHTANLIYTIPFVLYGVLRYLYLVYKRQAGDEPELLLLTDKALILNIVLYILSVFVILY
ncbi:MAG: decaprenyl-phosphate phosphoribosyltransferase [Candidatus Omnitrophica bacterium]|nr:decaprenyl-phosphate phosphoribosyltransferase [Candidatus Omnitrophota bacterium]MDD5352650.1 decaprenyl-phosphate phosphoribosyltransferase [Candidatus Omnitrophota bacterium]MDD5550249.1 decaprenyl-phosphate phosphoribosyltransferase [Candidatus Omnitrophota bacterium]